MTSVASFMVACIRCWTRVYTWRLPPAVRDARRGEIESDLWESAHDPQITDAELVIHMLMRLTLGIADDLAWRLAEVRVTRSAVLRSLTAAAVMCALLLVVGLSQLTAEMPPPPETPITTLLVPRTVPNPPPPPPPPTDARDAGKPLFEHGRTSYSLVTEGPPPVRIKDVQPVYPPVALAAGLEGQVFVRARITERGRVTDAEVAPAGILGQSALDAVQRWEFAASSSGRQRPVLLAVLVSFGRSR